MSSAPVIAPARRLLRAATVLDVGVVVATIAQIAAVSQIVEQVLVHAGGPGRVQSAALALMGATLVRAVLLGAREIVGQRAAMHVKASSRGRALAALVRVGPGGVTNVPAGELVALLGAGLGRLDAWVARYLPQRVLSVCGPLAIAIYVAWLDPLSAVVLVGSAPIVPVLMLAVGTYAEHRTRAQWTALAQLSGYLLDVIEGLPTLKLFGRDTDEAGRVAAAGETFRVRTMQALRQAFLSGFVLELLTTAAIAVVAVELGLRLLNGGLAFGATLQVLLLAPEFYRPLRDLGGQWHAALEGRPVAEGVSALLAAPAGAVESPPAPAVLGMTGLALLEVSYRYPGASALALEHVDMSLPRGSRTALVGPSGGGKSTIVRLLLRFVEPASGAISADGVPISSLSPAAWRERVAVVPQHPYLFDASALDNLRLARSTATFEEVVAAAELAGAHAFIRRLPDGYHTRLGERGSRLSRGQAQRLAIARAFLKDAPFLILDEPSSALDPDSERIVRDSLARLGDGRTVLIVAHRLASAVRADQIVVLDGGTVVERGSHAELVARDGLYAQLAGARARRELVA